jgi:hypothetical protein
MAKRRKVELGDVVILWNYYFAADAVASARTRAKGVETAVFYSDPEGRVLLRYPEDNRFATDYLRQVGGFILGAMSDMRDVWEDEPKLLTLDTAGGRNIYVIPFRTEAEDENVVDAFVALYGRDMANVAISFDQLSNIYSWEQIEVRLPKK